MQQSTIAVSAIRAGRNPRTYFDAAEMAELEASIAAQGVIQPILVRPISSDVVGIEYEIVAGERRWRAATQAKGSDYQIPAMVRDMTDEEADEAALIENVQRANMSPTEEAAAAAKVLARCEGNREEAARRLGWSRTTLDKRLALMNCSENVRVALNERKITLGHAELLAAVTKENQDKALTNLLAAPSLPTPAQVKAIIESIAKSLTTAIFDKTDCASCPHNSGMQNSLFAEAIAEGHCTNAACYDLKTEQELESRATALKDEYPVVRIVQVGENETLLPLKADGATGVGEEQAKACRGCAKFGAAVSAVPGKLGKVYKEICFDPTCNTKKVAERIKAEKAATEPQKAAAPEKAKADGKPEAKAAAGEKKAEKAEKAAAPKATAVQESTRVKDYRVKVWRDIFRKEVMADLNRSLMVLIALAISGFGRNMSGSKLTGAFEKITGNAVPSHDLQKALLGVSTVNDEQRTTLLKALAASVYEDAEERTIVTVLKFIEADITKHWKLNAEFLDLLTKSEIEVVAEELGIKAHMGQVEFAKALSKKKDEIIKALLKLEGFTYESKVPKIIKF